MNLHEYQAKELFERYGMPVSKRSVITNKENIEDALNQINFSDGCVAKVQAHTSNWREEARSAGLNYAAQLKM